MNISLSCSPWDSISQSLPWNTCSGSNIVNHNIYSFIPFLSHAPIYSLGSYDWNPHLMVSFGEIQWTNQVMGETQKMTSAPCDFYNCQATHRAECQNNSILDPSQPKWPLMFAMISLRLKNKSRKHSSKWNLKATESTNKFPGRIIMPHLHCNATNGFHFLILKTILWHLGLWTGWTAYLFVKPW